MTTIILGMIISWVMLGIVGGYRKTFYMTKYIKDSYGMTLYQFIDTTIVAENKDIDEYLTKSSRMNTIKVFYHVSLVINSSFYGPFNMFTDKSKDEIIKKTDKHAEVANLIKK